MPKAKETKKVTKSEFLRKLLSKNPDLDFDQISRRWVKSGHPGAISKPLFYQIRRALEIKTEWTWAPASGPRPVWSGASSPKITGEVYQFKITLLDTKPPIWRRIQVGDCTLDQLHEQIQTAMGWTNSHLHHFMIDKKFYGDPLLVQENFEDTDYSDSTTTRLSDIVPKSGKHFKFGYEYDFGDGWQHEVLFEGRMPVDPGKKYPVCIEGARACLPEDCGGVWGYVDFLAAIADPKNPEHGEMLEWVGRKFDPEAFHAVTATRRMRQGLPDWRSMR